MIVIITGSTGSGKTETIKTLSKMGCPVIPLYTTRKPRPDDYAKSSISDSVFETMKKRGRFIVDSSYNTEIGELKYGIHKSTIEEQMNCPVKRNIIIEGSYLHNPGLAEYFDKKDYEYVKVHLDVDDDTIINDIIGQDNRKGTEEEIIARLNRDREDMEELKNQADLVINNSGRIYSPKEVVRQIIDACIERGKKGKK